MQLRENVSLKSYHTFGLSATARYGLEITQPHHLQELMDLPQWNDERRLILGGGSNVLFTQDFGGLVLFNRLGGIQRIDEDAEHIWLRVGAGENWHAFVQYCIRNGYAGIENLSLIPGTVGAAPMQNIGAYGVEQEEVFDCLEAIDMETGHTKLFTHAECQFGYRESYFKHAGKGRYLITGVTYRLNKSPNFRTDYGAIRDTLKERNVTELTLKAVSEAVIHIRQSKLPDPAQIGNAGSFFKNPTISQVAFDALRAQYPKVPGYSQPDNQVKVPAGGLRD
ncbi:MAG TPA: UDP-N-acetylenolpyruvoylglucosamine reductase, partial [Cytophagales bacterium]|nr:UDP-N-acetylenolpyruvoylglucosamine reductase [Cytophagales bacterium]